MSEFFLKIVNMSISASWLVLAVLLLRLVLKKASKWVSVLLWGFVAVRLICPFSFESVLSLIPSAETISPEIMMDPTPEIHTGINSLNSVINPIVSDAFAPDSLVSINPLQLWIPLAAVAWIVGMAAMLVYTAVSYILLRRKVATAVLLRDNIFQSENVGSPFVLGIIKPKIYLPFWMDGQNLEHVVAHEASHIRRKDHLWKPFGFLLLALHWFNPLMWLGYVLLCRDIELACDEKVIKEMDNENRADYTQALVACSVGRRSIAACPLAFGEVGVKDRVKSVMNYKKPAFWIILLAITVCMVVAVCFLTNPKSGYGIGIQSVRIATDPEGKAAAVVELDYLLLTDGEDHFHRDWISFVSPDEGEYTSEGLREYDGALGEHRMMIKFRTTKPSISFRQTHTAGQVYPLENVPDTFAGKLKYKVVYPPEYSMVIYIGSDTPFGHKDPALYNVRYLGGTMRIRLYNALEIDESDIVAVSGGKTVPLVSMPAGMPIEDSIYALHWLTINPGENDFVPFATWKDGEEVHGHYTALDAETFETLEHFIPSGLDPQPYLFQNADPERQYIVLVRFAMDENAEVYAFGATFNGATPEKLVPDAVETVNGNLKTYYKNTDGTWQVGGRHYKYRLEITGRMNNAAVDSTFVYLSNIEKITFDRAWKAAGFSSNTADYFDVEDAVLVEWLNGDISSIGGADDSNITEKWDKIPMIKVNGVVYLDTGHNSTSERKCGTMDGEITSQVDGSETPTEDNQSNFGTGYGYQHGTIAGTIDLYMNGNWRIFATEDVKKQLLFSAAYNDVNTIDTAVSKAILEQNAGDRFTPDGLIKVESHYILGITTKSGTPLVGQTNHMEETTVYVQYVYHRYAYSNHKYLH